MSIPIVDIAYMDRVSLVNWATARSSPADIITAAPPLSAPAYCRLVAGGWWCGRVYLRFDLALLSGPIASVVIGGPTALNATAIGLKPFKFYLYTGAYPFTVADFDSIGIALSGAESFNPDAFAAWAVSLNSDGCAAFEAAEGGVITLVIRGEPDYTGVSPLLLDPPSSCEQRVQVLALTEATSTVTFAAPVITTVIPNHGERGTP